MAQDKRSVRYFAYLNLFIFSMLILVLASNFLMMFVGWELVGVCSYLLIGFWFEKEKAASAGKKAFIVNRIGDAGFILGIILIFSHFNSLDFKVVLSSIPEIAKHCPDGESCAILFNLIGFLLFLGAVGKSAQLPLHVWLPDAMEGPTPVSALIHAATMVTAGVYMVARCNPLYSYAPLAGEWIAWIGVLTACMAGSIALVQNDLKRILAYSTISQLGYMFVGVGLGAYTAGIFHLFTHAFFKALLFLGAGSIMHALHGELNIQKMGSLHKKMPITYITFLIGGLALAGFPPFLTSGFFSKDEILLSAWEHSKPIWAIGTLTAFMTALYVSRMFIKVFWSPDRLPQDHPTHFHESKII